MSINKKILLCFIALVVVGAVSLTLLHRSPKYLEQQQQAQNAQTVHSQDTKLPYDYLNNVNRPERSRLFRVLPFPGK